MPPANLTATSGDEAALAALVLAERTAASERDLATLAQLWADDARIIDRRGTDDPDDDYQWEGRDAILDRYVLAVFPAPPPPFVEPLALTITRRGDSATATLAHDRWRFTYSDGRWWLQELAY